MTNPNNKKLFEAIKALNIIYLALLFGQLMLGALFLILINYYSPDAEIDKETDYIINTTALLLTIIAVPAGYYIFSQKGKQSQSIHNENQKIELYRNTTILKLATFEIAGIANLIAFFLSRSQQSLLIFAIVIIVFLLNKPGQQRFYDNFE